MASDNKSAADDGAEQQPNGGMSDEEIFEWLDKEERAKPEDSELHKAGQKSNADADAAEEHIKQKTDENEIRREEIRRTQPDLTKRARHMWECGLIAYPDTNAKGVPISKSHPNVYTWLDAVFGPSAAEAEAIQSGPFFDTFKGRVVNHLGVAFGKDSGGMELVMAMNASGLGSVNTRDVKLCTMEWAATRDSNSLIEHMRVVVPEWDGVRRLDRFMVEEMQSKDDGYHERIGRYFFLSLYNRIMNPGCYAPMSLSIIGAQDIGKSFFVERLCQAVLGPAASYADVSAGNTKDILRSVTGLTVIALIGEMKGLKGADFESLKAFLTRVSDNFDFKFRDNNVLARQWILVMDGNKFEGILRDETGNRRFIPFIVGYDGTDDDGQYKMKRFEFNFDDFDRRIMQVFAECRAWMAENGMDGYQKFARSLVREVTETCDADMKMNRGTMKYNEVETHTHEVLGDVWDDILVYHAGDNEMTRMVAISKAAIDRAFVGNKYRAQRPSPQALTNKLTSMGFEHIAKFSSERTAYYVCSLCNLVQFMDERDDGVIEGMYVACEKAMNPETRKSGGKRTKRYDPTPDAVKRLWMLAFGGSVKTNDDDGSVTISPRSRGRKDESGF